MLPSLNDKLHCCKPPKLIEKNVTGADFNIGGEYYTVMINRRSELAVFEAVLRKRYTPHKATLS
jgi:hypothetical protein